MLDPARVYATEFANLCVPGEEVVAALSFTYHPGQELTAERTDDRVSFDPLNGLDVPRWNRATERFVGGVTLDVRRGSDAGSLVAADRADLAMTTLVLTGTRLFVAKHKANEAPSLGWERRRDEVAEIVWSPRLFQFGRIELQFRDGSIVRLMAGLLSPLAARRFVRTREQSQLGVTGLAP